MAKKTKAYVDTAAFVSFLDVSDTYHGQFVQLFSSPPLLMTTPLVIAEGHGWFLRRYDQQRAIQFLNFVDALTCLKIISVSGEELKGAATMIRRFADQQLTMADAVGLVAMDKFKVDVCWSADRHMTLTGKPLVIYQI
jgi:predicted nucleic acid-binding protein